MTLSDPGRGALTCLVLVASLNPSCGPASDSAASPAPPVVLWVEVDTLRADALGCYGNALRQAGDGPEAGRTTSPNLDALAADGVRFERAYATAPWTIPSVASQLTGLAPWEHGALRLLEPLDASLPTFVEDFQRAGWATRGVMTNFVGTAERAGFQRGFDGWDESLAAGHAGSTGLAAAERLLAGLDAARAVDAEQPLFLFLFLFEPHYRYEEHPGREFPVDGISPGNYTGELSPELELPELRARRDTLGPEDIAVLRSRYHGEAAQADVALGAALRGLEERGLLAGAWVVFTSDHGEELMERGWIGHTVSLHDELVRVPLVVRPPRGMLEERRGAVVPHAVSLVDLGATLRELAGVPAGRTPGLSFAESVRSGRAGAREVLPLHVEFEPPTLTAASREKRAHAFGALHAGKQLKWIVDLGAGEGPRTEVLYDLSSDPAELVPLELDGAGPWPAELELHPELTPANSARAE